MHPTSTSQPASLAAGPFAALATVVLWASAFPLIRIGLQAYAPVPLASLRFATAAVAMALWLAWLSRKTRVLPAVADLLRMALCAALGIAGYNIALNMGQVTVSAGAASFIVNTVPVITALLAMLLLQERFRAWAWLGTGISFAGVVLIASQQPGGLRFGAGATLVLAAAFLQACFFIAQRPLVAKYGALVSAPWVVIMGAVLLLPWLPGALSQAAAAPCSVTLAAIYLGLFPGAIGYMTWAAAQRRFGASRAANFLYLVPPCAIGLAAAIAGEVPSLPVLAGGALAVAGVALVNLKGK